MSEFTDILDAGPENLVIQDSLGKCYQNVQTHENIFAAISGGWDSDILMDMIIRCGGIGKTTFGFFNTGLEYKATKNHIKFLQEKYGVEIKIIPPTKPIPICVKEYGIPFWSKHVSEMMERLQRHNFQWEDAPLEVLEAKYPGCRSALRWWCNDHGIPGKRSKFNISYVPGLKEFIMAHPPKFRVSNKCCKYAKKDPAKSFVGSANCDLNCTGIRKNEGGVRSGKYTSCYTQALSGPDQYRPIFWYSDADKIAYDRHYGLTHSDCYKVWGMKRTGCAGCPFGQKCFEEIELARIYEPNFYKAMLAIFGPSYEYKAQFYEFRKQLKIEAAEGEDE